MIPLDNKEIVFLNMNASQYFAEKQEKKQFVIHHSAGWDNARQMFDIWNRDASKVAVSFGIGSDGVVYEGFNSSFWAYHVGLDAKSLPQNMWKYLGNNIPIHQHSIGVELCNWGVLGQSKGKFYSWAGAEVPLAKVVKYEKPFKAIPVSDFFNKIGQSNKPAFYYEKYSDKQIESLGKLILLMNKTHGIPLDYNADMWDISEKALKITPGIWTHVSYRLDKSDCHPFPPLIEMLKSLK